MNTTEYNLPLGIFPRRIDVRKALKKLKKHDVSARKLTVIAQDSHLSDQFEGVQVKDHADPTARKITNFGAIVGGALGIIFGLLVGNGIIGTPGLAPIMMIGNTTSVFLSSFAGGAVGIITGFLVSGLANFGTSRERALIFNSYAGKGYYFILMDGTLEEIKRAKNLIGERGIQKWELFYGINSNVAHE